MKKVSWNIESLDILISMIGANSFAPAIDAGGLILSNNKYFIGTDDANIEVLCKTLDDNESAESMDMTYEDSGKMQFTATAQEFVGTHPPHRPK